MKVKNSPGRKNDRRISAANRLVLDDRIQIEKDKINLSKSIRPAGVKVFTKKNRADRNKDKK